MSVEKQALIVWSVIFGIIGLFLFIRYIINKLRKTKILFRVEQDNLSFQEQYTYRGGYSNEERLRPEYLPQIIFNFRNKINPDGYITIESKFNDTHYAVFDLDCDEHLILFRHLYQATPYALFLTSPDHYWGIVDLPYEKIDDIFQEPTWKVCNDQNYISFCRNKKMLLLRGLYENNDRRPKLYTTRGIFSKNFQLFIDKLCIYYNKEGLELSVLRYKDPTMLIKYNRRRKLQRLKELENE
jgi:hypothetical protein